MQMRIEFNKINKVFNDDVKEFTEGITEDRFRELQQKEERTEEETKELNEFVNKYNQEINEYIIKRSRDEVEVNDYEFTVDEFSEIMETNSDKTITINGTEIPAPDYLEALYELFVKA